MTAWGLLLGVVALALVDLIVALGWTVDSRDTEYSVGRVMRPRRSVANDPADRDRA